MGYRCSGCGVEFTISRMYYPLASPPEDQVARKLSEKEQVMYCGGCFRKHLKSLDPDTLAEVVIGAMDQVEALHGQINDIRRGRSFEKEERQRALQNEWESRKSGASSKLLSNEDWVKVLGVK